MTEIDRTKLNQFIIEYFNDDEIHFLCAGEFRDVYNDFTNGMGKKKKVLNLTEWCYRYGKTGKLLLILRRERPGLYADYFSEVPQIKDEDVFSREPVAKEISKPKFVPTTDQRTNKISRKEMIQIPAGGFLYGDERKLVDLAEYWISKTAVTNDDYARFVSATGFRVPKHWENLPGQRPTREMRDHPVVYVSWEDAQSYAQWANCLLPTEQQWEKAARGTDGRIYPWGDDAPTPLHCNFGRNVGMTTPVGYYSPMGNSPYSCVDMSGNVWEWTSTWFDNQKSWRVMRGGSYLDDNLICRAASRENIDPTYRRHLFGFRIVESKP